MDRSLHHLLMSGHLMMRKLLTASIRDTELTPGQPKVLDYLRAHDGAIQKDIARNCLIEQATLTSLLAGMESKGLIERRMLNGNRRNLYVFLTDRGRELANRVGEEFSTFEKAAFAGLGREETEVLTALLGRVKENLENMLEE